MAFSKKNAAAQISMDRLAAVAGVSAGAGVAQVAAGGAARARRVSLEPDVSRIRKNAIEETPEERKRRLAAKTVNFGATIIARIIILAAAGLYVWQTYQFSGQMHRGLAFGIFAMTADLGRVMLKAMEPGSK